MKPIEDGIVWIMEDFTHNHVHILDSIILASIFILLCIPSPQPFLKIAFSTSSKTPIGALYWIATEVPLNTK